MAAIEITDLVKTFGAARAVDDLSLKIADGELIAFLGPSGCGKTTTMNCIAGLETPTSGAILFDGADVTAMPPHQRNIAMVFQASTLYPHLSARQNIAMSLRNTGRTRDEVARQVDEAAAIVDVTRLLDKLPAQLSGGERQRVATAKAIVRHPSVFLLDEPLASLDAALRLTLRAELVNLQKRLGTTMIVVTHDQSEAMTMGDRIAVMSGGRLEQIGTPDEIYSQPATRFVGAFIGSPPLNLIDGALAIEDGAAVFVAGPLRIPIRSETLPEPRSDVTLGIRPEAMTLADAAGPETLPAKVYAVEHLGRESILIAERDDGSHLRAVILPGNAPGVGSTVAFSVRPGATLHFFDNGSEGAPAMLRATV